MNTESVADALWDAMQEGRHMPPEWSGKLTMSQGYAVQVALMRKRIANGDRQAGWKVGLTARAMQEQQKVHEPCFGYLLESGRHPTGQIYRFDDLMQPGFENELCLTVGTTLRGPGVTSQQALEAITHVAPALEIVEVRGPFAGNLPLAMADNAQQKAFVTGSAVRLTVENQDLAQVTATVEVDDVRIDEASGTAVMGQGCLLSVVWLANKLAEFDLPLVAGMQIMSGSFTRQYAVTRPIRVKSTFGSFGQVEASFI